MMTNNNIWAQLDFPPFMQETDVPYEIYQSCQEVISVILDRFDNRVTGLWYLTDNNYGTTKRLVLRTTVPYGSKEYVIVEGTISGIIQNCIVYDFYEDLCGDGEYVLSDIWKEFKEGKALTVFYCNEKNSFGKTDEI